MTGARQVSKSILLKHIAQSQGKYYQYITFNDPLQLAQASDEPMLFMPNHTGKTELLGLPIVSIRPSPIEQASKHEVANHQ